MKRRITGDRNQQRLIPSKVPEEKKITPSQDSQVTKSTTTKKLFGREIEIAPSQARQVDKAKRDKEIKENLAYVEQLIDRLTDNRGYVRWIGGSILSRAGSSYIMDTDTQMLRDDYDEFKKVFAQYQEVGKTIPEDISSNFESIDSFGSVVPRPNPVYLSEEQVNRLKGDARDGAKRQQLSGQQVYSTEDLMITVEGEEVKEKEKFKNLPLSSQPLSTFESPQDKSIVFLTITQLCDPKNDAVQFAQDNQFMLSLNLETDEDINKLIDFMENPDNAELLKSIKAFSFKRKSEPPHTGKQMGINVTNQNCEEIQKMLDLMAYKCPNIASLSFGDFNFSSLTLKSGFANLITCSCGEINSSTLMLAEFQELRDFSCLKLQGDRDLDEESKLTLLHLPNLSKVSVDDVDSSRVTLSRNSNLSGLSLRNIDESSIEVTENLNLHDLSFGNVDQSRVEVARNPNLMNLSLTNVDETNVIVSENPNLSILSSKNVASGSKVLAAKNPNLTQLSLGAIIDSSLRVSETPKLNQITLGDTIDSTVDVLEAKESVSSSVGTNHNSTINIPGLF